MELDNEPIVQDWHVNSPVFFATPLFVEFLHSSTIR